MNGVLVVLFVFCGGAFCILGVYVVLPFGLLIYSHFLSVKRNKK